MSLVKNTFDSTDATYTTGTSAGKMNFTLETGTSDTVNFTFNIDTTYAAWLAAKTDVNGTNGATANGTDAADALVLSTASLKAQKAAAFEAADSAWLAAGSPVATEDADPANHNEGDARAAALSAKATADNNYATALAEQASAAATLVSAQAAAASDLNGTYVIRFTDVTTAANGGSSDGIASMYLTVAGSTVTTGATGANNEFLNVSVSNYVVSGSIHGTNSTIGLRDGAGYSFTVSDPSTITGSNPATRFASIGEGTNVARVVANGGPTAIQPNYRVSLLAGSNAQSASVTLTLAPGDTWAGHTTGNLSDVASVNFRWTDVTSGTTQLVKNITNINKVTTGGNTTIFANVDVAMVSGSTGGVDHIVKDRMFEYGIDIVDEAGVSTSTISTTKNSAISDNPSFVPNIQCSGANQDGQSMVVTWTAPSFAGLGISGYVVKTLQVPSSGLCDISQVTSANTSTLTLASDLLDADGDVALTHTVTGLTKLQKHVVWVYAYYTNAAGTTTYGSYGEADVMTAPAATTANPNQYWAGKFFEADVATYFPPNTAGQTDKFLIIQSLTGAPNPLASGNVTVYNGKYVDSDTASTSQADMNSSLSIKWKDDAINFGGESGDKGMEYICVDSSNISSANLTKLLAGGDSYWLRSDAVLNADGSTYNESEYWNSNAVSDTHTSPSSITHTQGAIWTTTGIGALGEGTQGGNAEIDNSYRYCKFGKSGTSADAGDATNGPQSGQAFVRVKVTAVTYDTSHTDYDATDSSTWIINGLAASNSAAGLSVGSSYIFALRVKNSVGSSAPLITTAKMVQGPANAYEFKAMDYGDLADDTSAIFNIATQKFEIRLKTDTRSGTGVTGDPYVYSSNLSATGGIPVTDSAVDFSVIMTADRGAMDQNAVPNDVYRMPTVAEAMGVTKSVSGKDILLTFDKVKIETGTMNAAETVTTYAAAGDKLFSALSGMNFDFKLIATNTHGATTEDTTSDSEAGPMPFNNNRQVFGTKAAYAALTTSAAIFTPTDLNDLRTSSLTTGADANYILSATLPVNAGAQAHGRKVDRIDYEVYQVRGNNTENQIAKLSVDVGTASPTVAGIATVSNVDYYTFDEDHDATTGADTAKAANKFNLRVLKSAVENGYPIKLRVNYASTAARLYGAAADATAAAAFALAGESLFDNTDAASRAADAAEDFVTDTADLTLATVPTNQDDECGSMGADVSDGTLTVHWGTTYQSNNSTLTGFRVELYDYASRTYLTKAAYDANNSNTAQAASDAVCATSSADGSPTSDFVVEKTSTDRSHTFNGLTNGRLYVPIVRTKTTQGSTTGIYSQGRTVKGSIGSSAGAGAAVERHRVDVIDKDDNAILSAARFRLVSDATDKTAEIFGESDSQFTPFGTPIVHAVVSGSADTQSLKIDDNGSTLNFGAMLQTSLPTNGATFGAAGQISNAAATSGATDADVFYLDLSFTPTTSAEVTAGAAVNNDRAAPAFYQDGSGTGKVTYSARRVTTVGTDYLGANWATETNYVFVSNAAGTTTGKISSSGLTALA